MVSKKYYITHISPFINDGGMARNNAFYKYFLEKNVRILNVFSKSILLRFAKMLEAIFILFFRNKINIIIHQGTFFYLFPITFLKINFFFMVFIFLLKNSAKRNHLTIEVNDLPYEQSIDLGLEVKPFYKKFEHAIFSIKNIEFIFASYEMEKYVVQRYQLPHTNTIINGGDEVKLNGDIIPIYEWENKLLLTFVYAGTLNKGRQIEELISLFSKVKNIQLILIGLGGEWIKDNFLEKNIIYMGNFEENIAHQIVSKCDIGIIPYDQTKFYYNLCYPTKASFYITAGIPFLSTPLLELMNVHKSLDIAFFFKFNEWNNFLREVKKDEILVKGERVKLIKDRFTWSSLISEKLD